MKLFGTFAGVFVPSFEAIFGAVLFLILPMLIGEVGLVNMVIIVLLANTATLATAFSIADCTSNLQNVGAGGMYAVAKRSLGRAFGGSIGIQLFLAQAASIGFYAIGFANPLQAVFSEIPAIADLIELYGFSVLVQKQIIASIIGLIALIAGLVGADFVSKLQTIIFVILSVSVGAILVSPFLGIKDVFGSLPNLTGTGLKNMGFWIAFATFFPAVTGIDAGVGMSGNLKDPRKSLAKGTFLAIGVTAVGYILITIILGYINPALLADKGGQVQTIIDIFKDITFLRVIFLVGILFATGSSALAYFVTSPRTAQALAKDKLLPKFLSFLGSDFKKGGREPRWATIVTSVIVFAVIWSGDIAIASLIVGICFLAVYGWVNLAAFLERISGNPSFRPTSKGHWAISLYGFAISIAVMFLLNPLVGIGVLSFQLLIFLLLLKYKSNNKLEGVWWGLFFSMISGSFKQMRRIIQGSKNWRPIVGIFCFADKKEESLSAMEMGKKISDFKGITTVNIFKPSKVEKIEFDMPIDAQIIETQNDDFDTNILSIIQGAVPGGLQINTAFLPIDSRVNLISLMEEIIRIKKNVLLYKHSGIPDSGSDRIDVWWKGEENGNFMALLSYIIIQSDISAGRPQCHIRMIRKLFAEEDAQEAKAEMDTLMTSARLNGEVLILSEDDKTIHETIRNVSGDATLILIGMPGKKAGGIARLFSLDKLFFSKELDKFKHYPPILFVKAASVMDLLE